MRQAVFKCLVDRLLRVLCLLEDCDPVGHEGMVGLGFLVVEQVGFDFVALIGNRLVSLRSGQGREPGGGLPSLEGQFIALLELLAFFHDGHFYGDLEDSVPGDEQVATES